MQETIMKKTRKHTGNTQAEGQPILNIFNYFSKFDNYRRLACTNLGERVMPALRVEDRYFNFKLVEMPKYFRFL